MRVMSYSPSVEAYVLVGKDREAKDLSADIVQCTVTRETDAASEFSITLQNKGWKYNGLFSPFDPITIFCTKKDRVRLFTGYVTTFDAFQLYQGDFHLSGFCTIYRIQNTYWDPLLLESQELMFCDAYNSGQQDNGYGDLIRRLLVNVGSWPSDSIQVQQNIPADAIAFAHEMYQANLDSAEQLKSMIDEFYEILRTHGPKISAAAGGLASASGEAIWNLYISWEGKFAYSQAGGRLDPLSSGYGDCSSTVYAAYMQAAGINPGTWTGDMITKGELIAEGSGPLPTEKMVVADLIIVNHSYHNPSYDHVEMFGPNDQYAGHGGPGMGPTIKHGAKAYGATQYDWQVRRYVQDAGGGAAYAGIDMNMSESAFVKKWGPRINAWIAANYPSGALNGHGDTIAREARKNGCDPRIIVAIAAGESGCGMVSTSGGSHGAHNYWSWGIAGMAAGIWSPTVDGAIAEFCEKFGRQYAGCSPADCVAMGYGEGDYIMAHWPPVIAAI